MGGKRMPERPNEKAYPVAMVLLRKVALVAFYQPKTSGSERVNKLRTLFEACICNGVPCLLFKFTKGLGGPAIVFIGSSLGGQVSQGCPKPDRPGRNRPPVAEYCAIAPAFQNKLLEM